MYWHFCSKATRQLAFGLLASAAMGSAFADTNGPGVDTAAGKAIYAQTCIACHGQDGKGALPGVADFTAADGPLSKTDEELLKSISEGLSTPGAVLSMPAKGGNPSLTDGDIRSLIAYLRGKFGG